MRVGERVYFDSEILAALNWLSALMAIACLLPVVFNEMLELKPAAWAMHLEAAAGAVALDAAADIAAGLAPGTGDFAALGDNRGLQIEPVGVAGAGEDHLHAGPADLVGRAAADALARTVVQRHGAGAGPGAGHAGERA